MFYHYQAYSLKKLADFFVESIRHKGHPFKQSWVVVQNNEVKEWLSLAIAEKTGIAANFKFIYPSELIWTLYRLGEHELAETLPDDKNALLWGFFSLFRENPDLLTTIPFLTPEQNGSEKQLFQFCSQLADVFDQYQVYRPHMLENWMKGSYATRHADEAWQAELFRLLNERITKLHGNNYPRRSQITYNLIKRIKEKALHQDYPDKIYVFGLSHLSKPLLEVLTALSLKTDIHFYNTAIPRFEGSFSPLAAKWAKPKTEQLNLLNHLLAQNKAGVKTNWCDDEAFPLAKVQIHSCHNTRREVEVLKDEILHFLQQNPDKTVDDVLVLVPDADVYSGLIESIFMQSEELKLPVSAYGMKNRQAVAYSLEIIVNLLGSSFKSNDVMQLLQLKPVSDTFGFSESNLNLIEKWLQDNKVFWGLGETPADLYSFAKGINQIAAGIAMDVPPLHIYQELAPYPFVKSAEQIQCWSKFSFFINKLSEADAFVRQPRTADEWLEFLIQLINDFAGGDEPHVQQKIQLTKNLNKIQEQVRLAGSGVAVPFGLIKSWLLAHLDSSGSGAGRFGNGIIISTYVPYRGIPFSFIAMLGLNESSFPRKSVRPVFDLMARAPQPGDRILKEDDSLLFLETKLAARQHLHLSFEGHGQQSASMKLPSILLQQWLDIGGLSSESGIISHGLHPFSKSNFSPEKRQTFLKENVELARHLRANKAPAIPFLHPDFTYAHPNTEASIRDIISFFQHPAKHFTQRVLDIKNYSELKVLEERELFQLNGFNKYSLETFVFEHLAEQKPENSIYAYAAVKPFISEGYAGQKQFQQAKNLVADLIETIAKRAIGDESTHSIHVNVGGIEFSGNIGGVYNGALVLYRPGKVRPKHLVELWLKHLFLLEAGISVSKSHFIGKDEKVEIVTVQSEDITPGILHGLVEWYWQNTQLHQKLNFFPESSKSYAECINEGKMPKEGLAKALKAWDSFSDFCEAKDEFNQLLWRDVEPLQQDAFKNNAGRFWLPLLSVLKKEGV